MNNDELITYNGKQYRFRDLPPEVQDVLRDDNNNGIPDRLEPKVGNTSTGASSIKEIPTEPSTSNTSTQIEGVKKSLIKKYLTTSSFFFIFTLAAGILIFILIYFAGVITT